jgi:hypothetical protein
MHAISEGGVRDIATVARRPRMSWRISSMTMNAGGSMCKSGCVWLRISWTKVEKRSVGWRILDVAK